MFYGCRLCFETNQTQIPGLDIMEYRAWLMETKKACRGHPVCGACYALHGSFDKYYGSSRQRTFFRGQPEVTAYQAGQNAMQKWVDGRAAWAATSWGQRIPNEFDHSLDDV
jgi:hypothetical protein